MNIKRISGTVLFISLLFIMICAVHSQVPVVKSINKVIIEGKIYYIHVVSPGQTLYSISKAYEIPENDIVNENPGVDKMLSTGQVLKIPERPSEAPKPSSYQPALKENVYTKHVIKEGETIYSLSKKYNTSVEEIEKANQDLILTDISIGQVINIPEPTQLVNQVEFIFHKVKRRETIYGICRKYDISEEDIIKYNPELKERFPHPGERLRIPKKPKITPSDISISNVEEIPGITDTLSLPVTLTDSALATLSYEYYLDSLPPISGRSLNIAYLIPFDYSVKIEKPLPEDGALRKKEIELRKKLQEQNTLLPESPNFLEFMEGSFLAIDDLRRNGISVNIFIFDTKQSPYRIREIINSDHFDKMDLIIGPFLSFNVEIVADYSKKHRIPVISPFYDNVNLIGHNPYLFQSIPSYILEFENIASYLTMNMTNKNIILIHGTDSLENIKIEYLKSEIIERLSQNFEYDSTKFKEVIFDNSDKIKSVNSLNESLSATMENQVIIPETDEAFVKPLVNLLFFQPKNYRITLFGMSSWSAFQSIDYSYLHQLSVSFFSPYYFSYDSTNVKHFLKNYTKAFYAEPTRFTKKGCPYAFIGYDLSYYFLSLIDEYGRRFLWHLDECNTNQLMVNFKFVRTNPSGGYENRALMLVKFLPDISIHAQHFNSVTMEKPDINKIVIPTENFQYYHLTRP